MHHVAASTGHFVVFFSGSSSTLKIVGICLGTLLFLCLVVASYLVCYKKRRNKADPGIIIQDRKDRDNAGYVTEDMRKQTTGF